MSKILFICKLRNDFYGPSFGLINSCKFISNSLKENNIESRVVTVIDANDIDREVFNYKPTHVFIEALWVLPSKFEELIPLHPEIKWYVRIHSKIPFLANEGIAIQWIKELNKLSKIYPQFQIAVNNKCDIETYYLYDKIKMQYFPNIYCPPIYDIRELEDKKKNNFLNLGCFGAIRPLKSQLAQAFAAIIFGNQNKIKINFHINSDRCETGGDPVLKNLLYLFKDTAHRLVFHPWIDHNEFIHIVKQMDIGLQVSMSETFNIVAADFVWNNIPLVGSDEIEWLDKRYKANPIKVESIVERLFYAYEERKNKSHNANLRGLEKYNKQALKVWLSSL